MTTSIREWHVMMTSIEEYGTCSRTQGGGVVQKVGPGSRSGRSASKPYLGDRLVVSRLQALDDPTRLPPLLSHAWPLGLRRIAHACIDGIAKCVKP